MSHRTRLPIVLVAVLLGHRADAQNDAASRPEPVAVWHFNDADVLKTGAKFLEPGPRPPVYPGFPADNVAFAFTDKSATVTVREADLPQ